MTDETKGAKNSAGMLLASNIDADFSLSRIVRPLGRAHPAYIEPVDRFALKRRSFRRENDVTLPGLAAATSLEEESKPTRAGGHIMAEKSFTEGQSLPSGLENVLDKLVGPLGNRLSTSATVREQHGSTLTWAANEPPDAVA